MREVGRDKDCKKDMVEFIMDHMMMILSSFSLWIIRVVNKLAPAFPRSRDLQEKCTTTPPIAGGFKEVW